MDGEEEESLRRAYGRGGGGEPMDGEVEESLWTGRRRRAYG